MMNARLCGCVLAFICVFAPQAMAQRWLSQLPPDQRDQPTIEALRQAFASYYREHPVDVTQDKVRPTFRFEAAEEAQHTDIEDMKMFQRWEWLVVPRSYPSGRLNLAEIETFRSQVKEIDGSLLAKLAPQNPPSPNPPGPNAPPGGTNPTPSPSPMLKMLSVKSWTPLGPSDAVGGTNMGRVTCIAFDPKNAKTMYLCGADGGVWKSTDGGATWTPKFDAQPTLSAGDLAIDPANSNVLFVATSDPFGYGVPFWGGTYSVGVMKSIDGGTTWTPTGLTWTVAQNRTIRRLVMHPTDPKILMAATSAGLFRTDDGGVSWKQILPASTYDVEFQQNNGAIVYATTNQVLKSTNAGASFAPLTATCSGTRYNIQIALSNPNTLYTLCAQPSGTSNNMVQKSTNAGATWSVIANPVPGLSLYGYYDNVLAVSPVDEKVVYVAGFNMAHSTNGGTTWSAVPVAQHPDNHVIKFAPGSSTTLFSGNDGGIFESTNSGTTWKSLNKGLAITQFYRLGVSKTNPNVMIAGAQDNGNMKFSSGTFTSVTNADGMQGFIDWSNANVIYAGIQYGAFYRSTNGGASFVSINTPGGGAWLAPWCQDPVTANTIYAGTDKVYKSTNQGTTWVAISGALAGIGQFNVLKVAPSNPKVIYAGSENKLYRTVNGGAAWTDVTAGLPVATNYLTQLAISDNNPDLVYATFSGYVAGEKVYRSTNAGATWANYSGTLPNMPVDTIVHQNAANNPVYIGTDAGVYYRNDSMTDWVPYKIALPNVIVDDLQINYGTNTIRAATYGRGLWTAPLF